MKITKILLFISLIISIVWMAKSDFEFEPITVTIGIVINLISITWENKVQLNKLKVSKNSGGALKKLSQSNAGGTNQKNVLEVDANVTEINQINT